MHKNRASSKWTQTSTVVETSQIRSRYEIDKLPPVNVEHLKTPELFVEPHWSIIHSSEIWAQPKNVSNITRLSAFIFCGWTI